jgi:hypothetical protein
MLALWIHALDIEHCAFADFVLEIHSNAFVAILMLALEQERRTVHTQSSSTRVCCVRACACVLWMMCVATNKTFDFETLRCLLVQ